MSPPRRSESVQLRGNSAQVSPPRRSELHGARAQASKRPQSVRVCRTGVSRRQAKGKLHRARAQVSPSQRSESVQLRGDSTGHAPMSKRPQSVRVCRTGVSRRQAITGNSTGHAPRCRLRSVCRARVRAEGARGCVAPSSQVARVRGPGRAEALSRRQAKGKLYRAASS